MFQKARIKLTGWYLLIIMLISIIFSLIIYSGINRELERFERMQDLRLRVNKNLVLPPPLSREFNVQIATEARTRLMLTLIFINAGIFVVAGFAGYFLSGRTLRPIKEMMDEQNRFITDASHELRTPLTSLRTSIEVNLRNKNMTLTQAKRLIKSNLEDVESLQVLSDGLIKLTYYQKPNGNTVFEKISLREIINLAIEKIKTIAIKNKIEINAKIESVRVLGDRKTLVELFTILLDNAIKYSKNNSSVEIVAKRMDSKTIITVSDKGVGIGQKDLSHIFERFYRAEKSRSKEDVSGYGLGLSIAKKIVQMHSGTIDVKSEKNKGTTFTVII